MAKTVWLRFAVWPRTGAWCAVACGVTREMPLASIVAEVYGAPLTAEAWQVSLVEIRESLLQAQPSSVERAFWVTCLKAAVRTASTGKDKLQNFPQHIAPADHKKLH